VKAGIGENWEDVRDGFLAWCERNRRPDTVRGYRSALGAVEGGPIWHDFAIIRGKPAVSITTKDLVAVRKSISGRGHIRQANLTVSALKTCFNWYFDETGSPLEMSPARPLMKSMDRKQEQEEAEVKDDGGLILTQEQMGLYVWGLSLCRNPAARLASCLQAMTGQRRMTACRARKSEFVAHEQYGKLWRMTPTGDKTHAWRVLPLPEFALQVVEDATVMTRADNPYLFPQQREARVGSGMDGHLSERVVSKVIEDMRKEGGPLHGLPFLPSTHTPRRTMISVLGPRMGRFTVDGRQLERKDVEMITHADEGREGTASQIYDKSQYLDVKYAILQGWQEWVMEGYAMVLKKRGEPGKAAA
jgi:integrase